MINGIERRVVSAIYRVIANTDEVQYRALDRLQALAGKEIALEAWLSTKPDPALVEAVLSTWLLVSPMRSVVWEAIG